MNWRNRIGLNGAYLFGMSGIGFTLSYLPVYLSRRGLADSQVMMISAVAALVSLAQFPVGLWADRIGRRKPFLVAALALLAVATIALPFAGGIVGLSLLVILFAENGICRAVVESLSGAEAAALARPGEVASALGSLRLFRPLGVVSVALASGVWAEHFGVGSILYWLAAVQGLAFLVSLLIDDRNRLAAAQQGASAARPGLTQAMSVKSRWDAKLWLFIVAMVLFHFCNAPAGVCLGWFLKRDLEAPDRMLSYAFVVSMIAWAAIAWPAGWLADRIGRRPLIIFGWITMAVRLGLLAVATSVWQVVAIQILDGVASGLFSILAAAWVTDRLGDARRVSEAQVIVGASLVLGSALGPFVAGLLESVLNYRQLFGLLAVIGGVASGLVIACLPETMPVAKLAVSAEQ
jgi:MFS family permease